ncbi:MAG: hypothetical protein IK080_07085 [Clostridia bacterium]|nr:hypothetical protein [Clostridia bacterium]
MKRIPALILAAALLVCLGSCAGRTPSIKDTVAGKTYVRERGGFGGDFTLTLNADGSYEYYEGALSSYLGAGTWSIEDDTVVLRETSGYDFVFRFSLKDGALIYSAEGSDPFLYVKAEDGDRFLPADKQ